ncbi:hypothetical protein BRADI_3g33413v3 [Brachypodium distachyon]|uniref:Uncharacterized protein n=1 Tax=Brachypodium distachyon TaxID=15368 RepID=A0A2K2D0T3_BRADI|nr:hypothetical protein BRADI_3g33413v3 [Brachypodium distachyon]PNT67893.1 hypothetical protein BRADI_3g33413v3 [Brachypodium distachyon]
MCPGQGSSIETDGRTKYGLSFLVNPPDGHASRPMTELLLSCCLFQRQYVVLFFRIWRGCFSSLNFEFLLCPRMQTVNPQETGSPRNKHGMMHA